MIVPADFEVIDSGMPGPEALVFTVDSSEVLDEFMQVIKDWLDRDGVMRVPPGLRFPTLAEARRAAALGFADHPGRGNARRPDGTWEPLP